MSFKAFRYLNKYVGKYRVKAHYSKDDNEFPMNEQGGIEESFDDLYIECKGGEIRHTYIPIKGDVILSYFAKSPQIGRNMYNLIREKYSENELWLQEDDLGKVDYIIYFKDSDMDKLEEFLQPKTLGKTIRPYSSKNLNIKYTIPEKDLEAYSNITSGEDLATKIVFYKKAIKEFDSQIQKIKGSKYDVQVERKKSNLKPRDFIHSIGLWNEFIEFLKEYKSKCEL